MIEASHLCRDFGDFRAVDDVSFSIKTGEIVGLLGPNGAGKTTTMRMITGFLAPTSGTVTVDGLNIKGNATAVKRKIGYMPESAPLYGDMIVEDYLTYIAEMYGKNPGEKLPLSARLCGIGEVMDKNISDLSRGYRQRVGLAHALMNDPEILILDEPTGGLDPNQIGEVRKAIDCNEHSLALLKGLPDKSKMAFVLGNLIYQYQQVGEFERALAAYDSLIVSGQGEVNPYGLCAAEVNVVHLFDEWGMEDEVFNHLEKAREAATRSAIPDAFLRVDNLATYYALLRKDYATAGRLLDSVATRLPDRSQVSFYHRYYDHYRTVLAIGTEPEGDRRYLAAPRPAIDTLAARPLDNLSVLACRLLGNALANRGEDALAIRAYQTCADYIGRHGLLNQQREIYYALAALYTRGGRPSEATRFYQLAKRANDRFTERRNAGLVSQFSVKYQTLEKERQNLLLEKELLLKQRTIRYSVLIILALVLLGGLFVVWLLMRHRVLLLQHELDQLRQREDSRRLEEKEQQLQAVSDSRSRLDQAYQELRMELVHKDVDAARQEAINRFSPRLLTQEEERKFRQQFGQLHPAFLVRLREACPGVTNSEELHAMLIRLRLNVDEIAFTLGINRSSVHTARSRLRKKLGIPKTSSLEDFLMKL